jgi:hypothetical protein
MNHDIAKGRAPLDYEPCNYAGSTLVFRGPRRCLETEYIAFLGGSETYGRFVRRPFPALVEDRLDLPCVNFGWPNAGPDVMLGDPGLGRHVERARAVVLQVPGALNLSNRFYRVHPRRNDRFLRAMRPMQSLFPDVDFTEYAFTRHLLKGLQAIAPERFDLVRDELRTAWVERMVELVRRIGPPVILLWFAARMPERGTQRPDVVFDPAFVTRAMLDAVAPHAERLVEVTTHAVTRNMGTRGMIFTPDEVEAARCLPGPAAHEEAALALLPALREVLGMAPDTDARRAVSR